MRLPEYVADPDEYLVVAGNVRTMDPAAPLAEAMAIRGDRILAIGTLSGMVALCPGGTSVDDFGTATILPGLTDAHLHMQRGGIKLLLELGDVDPELDVFIKTMDRTGLQASVGDDVPPTMQQRIAGLRRIQPLLHALGFTGIIDPATTDLEFGGYEEAWRQGVLTMRVLAMPYPDVGDAEHSRVDAAIERLRGIGASTGFGDEMLRIGGIKVYYDGEGMKGEALMGHPWPDGSHGHRRIDPAEFERLAEFCAANGWSMGVHAVGDKAIEEVISVFERVSKDNPIDGRQWQMIHGYLGTPQHSMETAARIGLVASVQPSISMRNGAGLVEKLGDFAAKVNPLRSWIDAGAMIAMGSDGPFFPFDPRLLMWAAITRKVRHRDGPLGPEEAITAEEALRGYTVNSAITAFAGNSRGMLKPGWLADWTVFDIDPVTATPDELLVAKVLRTEVGGRTVYSAP